MSPVVDDGPIKSRMSPPPASIPMGEDAYVSPPKVCLI